MFQRSILSISLLFAMGTAHGQAPTTLQEGPLTPPSVDVTTHPRAADDGTLTNDAIIRMTKAGLSEQVIEQAIQLQPGRYDTHSDDLIALKQAGVSDHVISMMLAHGTGLAVRGPASAPPSPAPVRKSAVEISELSPGLDEMGVYYKDKTGEWVSLKSERVVVKSGGWIKNAATHGLIKEDRNGTVQGEHSPLVLAAGTPLMIFAPEGTDADEYTFIQFREHSNRREFRVFTGGVFHGGGGSDRDSIDFKAQRVAPRMYAFNVPEDIVVGEYGVLPPGSASGSPSLNGNGKMFTFRITEANATKKP